LSIPAVRANKKVPLQKILSN